MAKEEKTTGMKQKAKWIVGGAIGVFVLLFIIGAVFGTPSADSVFKDMSDKMLQTKSVNIDQKMTMRGNDGTVNSIDSNLFMDLSNNSQLQTKGNFSLNIVSSQPMTVAGDVVKIGDSGYVKYTDFSSTNSRINQAFSAIKAKFGDNWIKTRTSDQYSSFADAALKFAANILPTPVANLNDTQRKAVLALLQDKSMYTITESSKVETEGVSAYKYILTYDKAQLKKVADLLTSDVNYLSKDDTNDSQVTSLTVWVNISTKQIIKIEYTGTTKDGEASGTITFSKYDQVQKVEKPADYFIESELLN